MNIYNLDQASQEMADIIWNTESSEELKLFISSLDQSESYMALHLMETMKLGGDDIGSLYDVTPILNRIMAL